MAQEIYLCKNIWLPINPNQIYDIAYTLMQYDVQPQIGVKKYTYFMALKSRPIIFFSFIWILIFKKIFESNKKIDYKI